jgi:ABC-type transporter Mla subunit MlaD
VVWEIGQQAHRTRFLVLAMEARIMRGLDELNTALDDVKGGLADHGSKLTEIGMDLDDLIATLGSGPADQQKVDDALAKATDIKAAIAAESDALATLAAKHDTPAPPAEPPTT